MACALRRDTKGLASNGVASGDVRRAAVSQVGQDFADQMQRLRHVFGSMTATTVYTRRIRAEALKESAALSTVQASDIVAFPPPLPRRVNWRGPRSRC